MNRWAWVVLRRAEHTPVPEMLAAYRKLAKAEAHVAVLQRKGLNAWYERIPWEPRTL